MGDQDKQQLNEILHDDHKADATVKRAIAEGLRENKLRGNKVAVWNGQEVVLVEPDGIDEDGRPAP
ncbi:MAG: hypothetical protein JNM85_08715 [Chthonomonas sp.]|nr:hypothetical protein [Chthonomonas sp.]